LWRTLLRAVALAAVLLVSGCGGGSSSGDDDAAALVPADAVLYAEAVVRPEGDQREQALEAAGKVLRTDDPEAKIAQLVRHEAFDELDYARDVEPWLGERAAVWTSIAGADSTSSVALIESTDDEKALESIRAAWDREGWTVSDATHRDVDYITSAEENIAAGMTGGFVVIGQEADVKRTIDASEGDSLADTDEYADAIDPLTDDRLAHVWIDLRDMFEVATRTGEFSEEELQQFRAVMPLDQLQPMAASFVADGDGLTLEANVRGAGDLGAWFAADSTPLVQELPGDSFAAFGTADVGATFQQTLDSLGGVLGSAVLGREFEKETGLNLERDLLSWIGDAAGFVRGTSLADADGGLIIQPTDEARAVEAFGKIVGAMQVGSGIRAQPVSIAGADQAFALQEPGGSAKPIIFARGSGLVVLAYGEAAAEAALGDDDRFGETDLYQEAEDLVGMEPSMLVSIPKVLEFVTLAGSDPELEEARPYLEAYSVIALGTVTEDDESTARLAAGFR